jgi:hypothetical protein
VAVAEEIVQALADLGESLDGSALTQAIADLSEHGSENADKIAQALRVLAQAKQQSAQAVVEAVEGLRKDLEDRAMHTEVVLTTVYEDGQLRSARMVRRRIA